MPRSIETLIEVYGRVNEEGAACEIGERVEARPIRHWRKEVRASKNFKRESWFALQRTAELIVGADRIHQCGRGTGRETHVFQIPIAAHQFGCDGGQELNANIFSSPRIGCIHG